MLFAGGIAILWAAGVEAYKVLLQGGPELKDILMLFIFIELGAMVAIYFKTNRLSVRFLVYVAITAITPRRDRRPRPCSGAGRIERSERTSPC